MDDFFHGLQFDRPRQRIPLRLIPVGIGSLLFVLVWTLVSHEVMFWLLLLAAVVLLWVASYGARQALAALHDLIHRLERI